MNEKMKNLDKVQNWIKNVKNDPIAKILVKNSHLTETQVETLLIDIISDYFSDKTIKTEEKAKLRIKGAISKGAFTRILKQAKNNVIRSIYTLVLLQYLGLISLTTIKKYLEIPEKVKEYLDAIKNVEKEEMEALRTELKELLVELAEHKKIKYVM